MNAIANHPDLHRRRELQDAAATVPFSQEQFCASEIDERVEAVRRLLDTTDFQNCKCESQIAGARLILRETANKVYDLYVEMFVAFRDSAREAVAVIEET
jgi:hypothetical protein